MLKKLLVLVALLAAAFSTVAQADELLIVDLSVPNQVSINATPGLSAVSITGSDTTGAYLNNFYSGAGGSLSATLVSGNLTSAADPPDNSPALFRGGAGTDTGLNLWSWTNNVNATFTAGSQAFSGSATWSLDSGEYADMLASNATGDIYFPADDSSDLPNASLLGTFRVVVPEPGSLSLLGLGLGIALLGRRR